MSKWKHLICGVLLAPLSTYPATLMSGLVYLPFMDRAIDLSDFLLVATFGAILFAYPSTLFLGLLMYFVFRNSGWGKSLWLYVSTAIIFTALIANSELLEKDGLFGLIYLSSAAFCSYTFWLIAISWPSRVNKSKQTNALKRAPVLSVSA